MAWEGYFCLGGTEIVNNARAIEYARTASCPVNWIVDSLCPGVYDMLNGADTQPTYDAANIPLEAPWYDTGLYENVPSQEFLGVYCIDVTNLDDSTVEASSDQRILAGSVIGNQREASRVVRFRCLLTAMSADGLSFGLDWLKSRLRETACETHAGGGCGTSDLTYYVECSAAYDGLETWEAYDERVDGKTRRLHGVKCISGPLTVQEIQDGRAWGRIVEFTLEASTPQPFSLPRRVTVSDTGTGGVQDIPINLVEYPSAELGSGSLVIARNLSENPSVEIDASGWAATSATITGTSPAAFVTSGRVTGELAADPTPTSSSFRVRLLGDGSTVASSQSWVRAQQYVDLTSLTDERISATIWASCLILGGASASAVNEMTVTAAFYNGVTLLSTVTIGTTTNAADFNGRAYAIRGQKPPVGTTQVLITVAAKVTWQSNASSPLNSDIRLYADALAVTVP